MGGHGKSTYNYEYDELKRKILKTVSSSGAKTGDQLKDPIIKKTIKYYYNKNGQISTKVEEWYHNKTKSYEFYIYDDELNLCVEKYVSNQEAIQNLKSNNLGIFVVDISKTVNFLQLIDKIKAFICLVLL